MAYRVPPLLPIPARFYEAVTACMAAKPLQHQDELVMLLSWLAALDPPFRFGTIVEIGSHRGGTLELWARLAQDCVVAIDLPNGVGGGLAPAAMQVRNTDFATRFPHVIGIAGDSHEEATAERLEAILNGRPIDLLFLDGDHTAAGVEADVLMYAPLVRDGGVIAFHDVTCSPDRAARENLGVTEVFASVPPPRWIFSVGHEWGGIGVVVA